MNIHQSPPKDPSNLNLGFFRVRMIAKLCIVLVCAFQMIPRLLVLSLGLTLNSSYAIKMATSFSFLAGMIIAVAAEYFLFKKRGSKIIKYSPLVDLIIFLLSLADWIFGLVSDFQGVQNTKPPSFTIPALYSFTIFAWRTVLMTLIVQKWYLKVIPPAVAMTVATGYAIHYAPKALGFILIRSIAQVITITIILYCEDKLKWKMMWTNLQQEKWIQMNNFILNNIPENIMILSLQGQIRFMSDYCKGFVESCNFSLDDNTRDFFSKIHNLHQLQNELVKKKTEVRIERLTTGQELLRGNSLENQLPVETLQDLITNFKKIIEANTLQEKEFLIYNGKLNLENMKEKSIEMKVSFVQNFQDEYIILILRDTTQRDRLIALEEANKYKDQLLASVSHELRAPLNGNINLVESAVNSKKIPDIIKETLLIPALRSSKFLLHIINDILDMSQIKEKKLRLVFQPDDIRETIKSSAQLVELHAKKKGVNLVLELDRQIPRNFSTDHVRLSQIILNLINNAIKFTKEGGMVKLLAIPLNENLLRISVEDTGIGMTEENARQLFRSYTQIDFEERQKMNPTGVGLGLNIAYNLAILLGPKDYPRQGIHVTSAPGEGSTFTFILENKEEDPGSSQRMKKNNHHDSCEIAEETPGIIQLKSSKIQRKNTSLSIPYLGSERAQSELLIIPVACSCPQVLVVDDNPFNTMAFETILSSLEVACDSVYSGSCAIKKLLKRENQRCSSEDCKPYTVVFIDQEMPEMNGSEAVKEIRRLQGENRISSSTRIIGCTAHKSKEEVERFMESGLDQCIHKPISLGMIKEILAESSK